MPNDTQKAREILETALYAIEREAGVRLELTDEAENYQAYEIDAVLRLQPGEQRLFAEIKKWAAQANFGALVNKIRKIPGEAILIADYINPNMAERLRREEIQYIDTAGNAYIHQPGQHIYIKGNQAPKTKERKKKDTTHRAFEPKGLILVYAFLCEARLVACPYREIADKAGVAVGTVGWVINALKAGGYIQTDGRGEVRKLTNQKELFERWVEEWPMKLKAKLHLGEFEATDTLWREGIDITEYGGYWGGEIAGAKYTNHLRPEETTIYIAKEQAPEMIRRARLRKAKEKQAADTQIVHVYEKFWAKTTNKIKGGQKIEGLVHPILAYADLIATGDVRNLETAKILYDKHLEHQLIQ